MSDEVYERVNRAQVAHDEAMSDEKREGEIERLAGALRAMWPNGRRTVAHLHDCDGCRADSIMLDKVAHLVLAMVEGKR